MPKEFKLPELAENVDTVTVTRVMIAEGDMVEADQAVLEVETEKAAAEVPSTVAGKVTEVRVAEGDTLHVGDVVFVVEEAGAAEADEKPSKKAKPEEKSEKVERKAAPAPAAKAKKAPEPEEEADEEKPAKKKPAAEQELPEQERPEEEQVEEQVALEEDEARPEEREIRPESRVARKGGPVPASPSVRRLAREIGVDINAVPVSEQTGRISEEDVKAYARQMNVDSRGVAATTQAAEPRQIQLPDFARWGEIERKEMNSVRRRTAENMAYAWTSIPHVTQFDKADGTEIEKLRKLHGKRVEAAGAKLTVTAILVKLVAAALKKFPQFNASIDLDNGDIIYKKYYNVGIAVDTERGLLVPVIRDVDKKNILEISLELGALAERARNRKSTLDEMQGGTFTISNLGGIGGTAFTPIVNPPEVAILGVSRTQVEPVLNGDRFEPRPMLPLSLSYDHRVIDGADGARFMRWLVEAIEQPFLMFLEG